MPRQPTLWWTSLWFASTLVLTIGLAWTMAGTDVRIVWLLCWLSAASLVTTVYFGIDKLLAKVGRGRIPERSLWLASFVGGSPGAWVGMQLFRHKTAKTSFQAVFRLVVVMQAILLAIVTAMSVRELIITTRP